MPPSPATAPGSRPSRAPRAPTLERMLQLAGEKGAAVEIVVPPTLRVPARVVGHEGRTLRVEVLAPGTPEELPASGGVRAVVHVEGKAWELEADVVRGPEGVELREPRRIRQAQRRASARIPAAAGSTVLFASGELVLRRPIVDLASSGLGVAFTGEPAEPAPGTALSQLRFSLPLGGPIVAAAVVRHIRARASDGVRVAGLDLMGLREEDARRLDAWVRGQTRTRKREDATRAQDLFASSNAVLHGPNGRERTRAVVDVHPRGLTLGLVEADKDLAPGARLRRVELWHEGVFVIGAEAEVGPVVRHRARPLHAQLTWQGARPEDVARLTRLLRRLGR